VNIFWSWQSDTPGKIGRFLIRDALKDAIDHLKQSPDVEEPTARENREGLHLDHDVQNIPGSPDLARAILNKIDNSYVVIADVTTAGKMPDIIGPNDSIIAGKKLINSNVAIELGYALKALTDQRVLMVFNAHYGTHEELPFDLRHKGGSIVFNLPPDADATQIKDVRTQLKMRFVAALTPYLKTQPVVRDSFPETPITFSKAAYFSPDETLASIGEPDVDQVDFSYSSASSCYLRLIPVARLTKPIPLASLNNVAQRAPILTREHNALGDHNQYGAIGYIPGSGGRLKASTQLFQNGEIWSISQSLIIAELNGRPAWVKVPLIACGAFESAYYNTLHSLIRFARESLDLKAPWQVEFGLVGLNGGLYLGMPDSEQWGPIRKSEIIRRSILSDDNPSTVDTALLDFFSEIFDSAGYSRPEKFNGFPS
jgi:hypothetical protein